MDESGVRFVLVGGLAMVAHGSDYVTTDIDVGYARDPVNLTKIVASLRSLSPRPRDYPNDLPFAWDVTTLRAMANATLTTSAGNLDLRGDIAGAPDFDGLWRRAVTVKLYGRSVKVASVPDLIAMKIASGRSKDMGHILELQRLLELQLDGAADPS